MKHIKEYKEFLNEIDKNHLKESRDTKLYVYPTSKKDHQMISNWLEHSAFHAEETANHFMFSVDGQRDADKTETALDKEFSKLGANARFVLENLNESFHTADGTPIGVDHLHRPITGTYPPVSLDESKIGDIYIMAAEAPNFPTFMKEFIKEYGEVKGRKEEKDLNDWLKNVWDERPTI